MKLRDWRKKENLSLADCAKRFGLTCANPAAKLSRWECGVSRPDADAISNIEHVTGGAVTAQDMHETRLDYLNARKLPTPTTPVTRTEGSAVR